MSSKKHTQLKKLIQKFPDEIKQKSKIINNVIETSLYDGSKIYIKKLSKLYEVLFLGCDLYRSKMDEYELLNILNDKPKKYDMLDYDFSKENNIAIYDSFDEELTEEQIRKIEEMDLIYDNVYLVIKDEECGKKPKKTKQERFENLRKQTYKKREHIIMSDDSFNIHVKRKISLKDLKY